MNDLDEELMRYRTLAFLVHRAKERALGAPSDKFVLDLGIVALDKTTGRIKGPASAPRTSELDRARRQGGKAIAVLTY
jgi:hypothetical protein